MQLIKPSQSGQALITLLVFVAVAIMITAGAITVAMVNLETSAKYPSGESAYNIATAGADNAVLRVIRDPNYAGERLPVGEGFADVNISGTTAKTITSEGTVGDFRRKVRVEGSFNNGAFVISSWEEID